jgi:histidine triad (HIT) family protein
MDDCIFCKIINNEIPASKIMEDENILAFHDINPKAPTHILVIPKKHIVNFNDLNPEDRIVNQMIGAVKKIGSMLEIPEYKVQIACGKDGGQVVFHIHIHILANSRLKSIA